MSRHLRFRHPLPTGLFLAGGLAFISAAALAEEPVVIGGSGQPSITVDLSVLEELDALQRLPRLLMPGHGPARNGPITLRRPGPVPQMEAPVAADAPPVAEPKIVLTPPTPKKAPPPPILEMPEMPPAPEKAPMAESKIVLTPPTPEKAPPPIAEMPEAPPPPVTLTEPQAFPPSALPEKPAPSATTPASEETAKLPPATAALEPGKPIHVVFGSESAQLSDKAKAKLEEFALHLKSNPGLRIQLLSYASDTEETASQARRLSLSRALVVRSFLIEQGLSSIRIDVRALGNKGSGEPANRVDLVFTGS